MVLLILAAVAIGLSVGDNGIITSARNATKQWEEGAEKEQDELKQIANFINSHGNGNGASESGNKIANAKPSPGEGVTTFDETTELEDDLGNIVKVPSGFGIAEESGTKVEEGIVIEDDIGNQFVWIPVGEYKTTNSTKTNNLVRRSWEISNGVAEPVEVAEGETIGTFNEGGAYYGEEDERSLAKDQIEAFKTSANSNKGFYTGRYEQGKGNVCKAGVEVDSNISIRNAKSNAEAMYSENVTGELISSYAWDTTLNFIAQNNPNGYALLTTTDSQYGNIGTGIKKATGEDEADNYCNIHDMVGNFSEWTTEYVWASDGDFGYSCVNRGGNYNNISTFADGTDNSRASSYMSDRAFSMGNVGNTNSSYIAYRVQLYL